MTYNEKKRWKVIESEIEEQEQVVENLKNKLASFDFSNIESKTEFEKTNQEFLNEENKLQTLMSEWETLSEKQY